MLHLCMISWRDIYRYPEEIEKEEQAAAEKVWLRRGFRVNGLLQLQSSLLLNLRCWTGRKVCRSLPCLFSSSPLKNGVLSLPLPAALQLTLLGPRNGEKQPLSALKLFFLKLLKWKLGWQKMNSCKKKENISSKMLLTEAHVKQEANIDRSGNIVTTDSQ